MTTVQDSWKIYTLNFKSKILTDFNEVLEISRTELDHKRNFIQKRFFFYFYFFLFIPKFILAVFVTHEETAFEKSQESFHSELIPGSQFFGFKRYFLHHPYRLIPFGSVSYGMKIITVKITPFIMVHYIYFIRSRKPSPETWKTNWCIDKTNYPNK